MFNDPRIIRANNQKRIRREKAMNENLEQLSHLDIHPKVIEAIDDNGLTALQGLILQYLTDPNVDYGASSIAGICQKYIGQGSRRSVRRVSLELGDLVDGILLVREMETMGDEFTTENLEKEDEATIETLALAKGGNGEDKEPIVKEDADGFWDVTEELDCVTACSKAPEYGMVFMSSVARKKISLFMKWAGNQEWLAYLVGKWLANNTVEVVDLMLPSQNANSTLVSKVIAEEYNKVQVVGVIHSHHEMGGARGEKAGFSGHDDEFINSNHNVSLLVAKDGIAGHIRVKTPCGAFIKVTAKIRNMDEVTLDEKKLQEEFKSKIRFGHGRGGHHKSYTVIVNGKKEKDPLASRDSYHF